MPSVSNGLRDVRKNGSTLEKSNHHPTQLLRSFNSDDKGNPFLTLDSSSSSDEENRDIPSNGICQDVDCRKDGQSSILRKITKLVLDDWKLFGSSEMDDGKNNSLVEFKQPKELEKEMNLSVRSEKASQDEILDLCRKVIQYSVKTSHPHFYNQLYGGIDEVSLAGSWLTDALNTSQATYETSPVFTILERYIFKYLGAKCGWLENEIDGIFSPGGSMANIYAMILARHEKFPKVKVDGVASCGRLVMFASEDSHYSFVKGSFWMGHGGSSVIKVKTDERGCMCPVDLEKCIIREIGKGSVPFMIACTSGTTVLAAFDDINEVVPIAQKYNLWIHVDAALGGTVLFSKRHRHLMKGIESVDSVTWNLHKMGGIPLQCSVFMTRHPDLLLQSNCLNAEYLFQNDKYYDASYDSGDKSIQCGRKVDSLKLYLGLFARGEDQMESLVDNVFYVARYATEKVKETPGFKLVLPDGYQGNNICFWYIPSSIRGRNDDELPSFEVLHKVAPLVKAKMMTEGRIMVNYQPLTSKKLPNFFRLVLTCVPPPTTSQMDFFFQEIARLGEEITIF